MHRAVTLLFALALGLCAAPADAFHYITPTLLQIPPEAENPGTIGNVRWAGLRYVLFDSDADLLGNTSTGRHVYLFDLQERDTKGTLALTQLSTEATGDNQRARSGQRAVQIAYDARIGGVGPRQLMLIDRNTGSRHQLTAGALDSKNAVVDEGERVIVFESAADFFGTGAGGTQIYKIDLHRTLLGCPFPCLASGNAGLTQITDKTGNSRNATTGKSGKYIYFESDADLLTVGQTENQIYLYDSKANLLSLVTYGPGPSRNPTTTANGGRLVFESDANLLGNNTGGTQLFRFQRTKHTLEQLTAAPGGACTNPSISANGHAVAFLSSDNLLGPGSTGPEVYSYDFKHHFLQQLTDAPGSVTSPAYASGVFTVFLADGDVAGTSSPGMQLLLVNLYALAGQTVP